MVILPGVKPWVLRAANEISARFGPITIYGVGLRPDNPDSDHPKGLAIDSMVGSDKAKGDAIASYLIANAGRLGITYIIWYARYWSPSTGWTSYSHPSGGSSPTQMHMDHVHASFRSVAPSGSGSPVENPQGFAGIPNPLAGLEKIGSAVSYLTDTHNWIRAGLLVGGVVLLIFGLLQLDNTGTVAKSVKVAKGAVSNARS